LGFTNLPGGYRFTQPNQGSDTSDSDVDPNTGRTGSVTIQPGDNNPTLWAGLYISPTAISLSSFTATREGQDVVIGWQTGAELNTFGYRVLRSTTGNRADAVEVTSELVAAQGRGGDGASYRWIDPTAQANQNYTYWLVEVETNGTTNEYGPARIIQPTGGNYTVMLPLIVR
jgi:hypothetical protein